jgi:hypothetical protein
MRHAPGDHGKARIDAAEEGLDLVTSGTSRAAARNSSKARGSVLSSVMRSETSTRSPARAQLIRRALPLQTPAVCSRSSRL